MVIRSSSSYLLTVSVSYARARISRGVSSVQFSEVFAKKRRATGPEALTGFGMCLNAVDTKHSKTFAQPAPGEQRHRLVGVHQWQRINLSPGKPSCVVDIVDRKRALVPACLPDSRRLWRVREQNLRPRNVGNRVYKMLLSIVRQGRFRLHQHRYGRRLHTDCTEAPSEQGRPGG